MKQKFLFLTLLIVALFTTTITIQAQVTTFGVKNAQKSILLSQARGFALADGYYCYEGVWCSDRYSAQPCRIEFTKRGRRIIGTYTNEYWQSSTSLTGTLNGSTLRLTGTSRNGRKLVITLPLSRGLWRLTGNGSHGVDRASIPLERLY